MRFERPEDRRLAVWRSVPAGAVFAVILANTLHADPFKDAPHVLFIWSLIDDPDDQDRVWLD